MTTRSERIVIKVNMKLKKPTPEVLTEKMELIVLEVDRNARKIVLGDRFGRSYELWNVDPYLLSRKKSGRYEDDE